MTRTIVNLSVAHILERTVASTDIPGRIDWLTILAAKCSHDHFDWLVGQIAENGFTVPITLIPHGEGEDGETEYTLGNGHHRFCAAILLGLEAVPVIIAEHAWDWVEDSHDGNFELPEPSFEIWELLSGPGGILEGYAGDEDANAWRAQYKGSHDDDDADRECANCGAYMECDCCHVCQCSECNCESCICEVVTPEAVEEYGYAYIMCQNCNEFGYRVYHMACDIPNVWSAAHRENAARMPVGMWHPAYILNDAYGEHENWLADAPLRAAYAEWRNRMAQLRDAVKTDCSDTLVNIRAAQVASAWNRYSGL